MNIGAEQVSVIHGGRILFQNISFQVSPGDKIGLIGKNGAGKSTLLKLLAGINDPDEGQISRTKEMTIGYLPQEMPLPEGKTVFEETSTAFQELLNMNHELEKINEAISTRTDHESRIFLDLIHKQAELNEILNRDGWFEISMKVEKVLLGLGFTEKDFNQSTGNFSGGWRMRIELAKILLISPDLLLLDEPTNHLDIESIQWLESFLSGLGVSIVLISHDITFLNKLTNRTIEISQGKLYDYPLPYSEYLVRRREVKETLIASQKNQLKKIKETEDFINRFRAKNTKAKQVQSRIKMMDRMDIIEVEEEDTSSIRIRFPEAPRSGKVTLEAIDLKKSYGDKKILEGLSFLLGRGEKIAFVGKNGAGKTTLSKMIVGETDYEGQINTGHQVVLGYYAQDQSDTLDKDQSVFSAVESESKTFTQNELRTLLGAFLFSGEDQFKKVKVLSGGEKARLALCKLLLKPVNFLVLDEPTNHLDIQSKKILKEALIEFKGTLIIVSHDRDFLTGLTDKVFEFTGQNVRSYIGDIKEFLATRKIEHMDSLESSVKIKSKKSGTEIKNKNNDYEEKKRNQKLILKIRQQISRYEKEISELEEKLSQINQKISQSNDYQADLINEYQLVNQQLEKTMKNWEKESIELEKFEGELNI